jgi:Na+/H+-dicarboxylate symporter|uniref:Amino acid transporter n=2 Tax=cellular organisms TaxID=131567 RepID=A0A1Y0AW95_TENMO|nr:Na+ -symporter 1 [Tenebrio molitor]
MSENGEVKEMTNFEILESQEEKPDKPSKWKACLKTNFLTLATIGGVVCGIILGVILKETVGSFTKREVMYVSFVGDIFLRMLKSLILPLIISSLVSAIASLDLSLSGRIAARAIAYYLTTTVAAVLLGIALVASIRPGSGHGDGFVNESTDTEIQRNVTTVDTLLDLVRNMFPPNIIQACVEQTRTNLVAPANNKNETDLYNWDVDEEIVQGTNILGLVVVAVVVGIALAQLGEETRTIANFFHNLMALSMKITTWIIKLSPVGILFLVTAKIMEMEDMGMVLGQLGLYFATVMVGLLVQGFIVLPLIYLLLTRKSPIPYIINMSQAIATAFGTASSSATLPVTIQCLEEKNGIDPRVARFALPIGAAINMDGTALYEAVAAIFIAQVREVELTVGTYIAISITATAASIGAAGIPQAGLVTMVMVLDTVGLPAEDVSLILAVDWLLDRFRTAINVMGDAFGAGIVAHRSQKELNTLPKQNETS